MGVNTGLIWIGDPVDVLPYDAPNPGRDWEEFRRRLENEGYTKEWYDDQGQPIGLTVSDFGGDGSFPTYVRRDETGRILELRINFDEHWQRVWEQWKSDGTVPDQPDHPEVSAYQRTYDTIVEWQRQRRRGQLSEE